MSSITGFNSEFFYSQTEENTLTVKSDDIIDEAPKKKRGRPPKKHNTSDIVTAEESSTELTPLQSNTPYIDTFAENNNMLKGAIYQLDALSNEVNNQIQHVISSKTIKRKYDYISDLSDVASSLISSKISAIRELNSTIKTCHDLELKKMKELKIDASDKNDDQRLMDMYNAYISTPIGASYPLGPSAIDLVTPNAPNLLPMTNNNGDALYQNYLNNKTPEQNYMMQLENPNIKTVVVYDQGTGQRKFDVVDVTTGLSVPNMPLPDPSFLDDTNINLRTGTARNSNINKDYPLIVVGESPYDKF